MVVDQLYVTCRQIPVGGGPPVGCGGDLSELRKVAYALSPAPRRAPVVS
jgi:hypothetical protein